LAPEDAVRVQSGGLAPRGTPPISGVGTEQGQREAKRRQLSG